MKYASSVAMLFVLALAGSAVWAQCCPAACPPPQPVVQCPCPAPEPVCPPPCPAPCPPPCPASVPAAVGAGPAPGIAGLECPDFDPAYARKIYEQNSVIIAVTQLGMQNATDRNLRNISGDINARLVSANNKLATKYGICPPYGVDAQRAQAIIAGLCGQTGECFDIAYAKTLSELVKQSNDADKLAGVRAVDPTLQKQALFMSGQESDWAFRLDRWITAHGYTA